MSTEIDWRQCHYMEDFLRTMLPVNVAGLPSLAIPSGMHGSGLPMGLQLIGGPWSEPTLLRVGCAFQNVTDHHLAAPGPWPAVPDAVSSTASSDAWLPASDGAPAPMTDELRSVTGSFSAEQRQALQGTAAWLERTTASLGEIPVPYSGGPEPDDARRWLMPEPETAGE
jgi:hypothetical protein